ncbi:Transcription factor bHLH123 [Linum perenne]
MADEFNTSINWWDSSRNRFDNSTDGGGAGGGGAASSSSSSGLTSLGGGGGGGCFSWAAAPDMTEAVKSGGGGSGGGGGRSSMDSVSVSTAADTSADHIHMMGLGLSSHAIDWNQALLRGEKGTDQQHQSSFRSMLQIDNLNSTPPGYSHQQEHGGGGGGGGGLWRERSSSSVYSSETGNSMNEFKQIGRGFSLDQPAAVHDFCQLGSDTSGTGFQLGSGGGGGGSMFHGGGGGMMLGSEHNHHGNSLMGNYPHPSYGGGSSSTSSSSTANFGIVGTNDMSSSPNWSSNKVPQFLRSNSPPPPKHTQLHFSNNAPFWNASGSINTDVRPAGGFFPPTNHQQNHQFPAASSFDDKPKNIGEEGNSSAVVVVKKSEGASANKRPRNETAASTLPAFKVRKEKMGDRITALQQLVSPFGKTDTASVLSEAIEYIKFLHDQIGVLSTPYMKSGAPIHHQQQSSEHHHQKSKDTTEAQKDLRSRGLCLVPVSSTFPVTHETTVDFWTPTFGGTFR